MEEDMEMMGFLEYIAGEDGGGTSTRSSCVLCSLRMGRARAGVRSLRARG